MSKTTWKRTYMQCPDGESRQMMVASDGTVRSSAYIPPEPEKAAAWQKLWNEKYAHRWRIDPNCKGVGNLVPR